MNHPDDLQLAAFVEGHLAAADRDRVLAHLADCSTCAELIAETQRFLEGSSVAPVQAFPTPHKGLTWPALRWVASVAVAATLVWAVAGPWRRGHDLPSGAAPQVASLAEQVLTFEEPGLAFSGATAPNVAALRRGVATVDLEVALAQHDLQMVEAVATSLRSWQASADESRATQLVIDGLSSDNPQQWRDSLRRLEALSAGKSDTSWFRLGRWLEAGRLAALSGDEVRLRGVLASALQPEVENAEVESALRRIGALTPGGAAPWDLEALAREFRDMILRYS